MFFHSFIKPFFCGFYNFLHLKKQFSPAFFAKNPLFPMPFPLFLFSKKHSFPQKTALPPFGTVVFPSLRKKLFFFRRNVLPFFSTYFLFPAPMPRLHATKKRKDPFPSVLQRPKTFSFFHSFFNAFPLCVFPCFPAQITQCLSLQGFSNLFCKNNTGTHTNHGNAKMKFTATIPPTESAR